MGMDTFLVILIVILIIVVMIRGPKTLPLIGGMLGRGVKEVRKGASELQASQDATPVEPPATRQPPPHRPSRSRRPRPADPCPRPRPPTVRPTQPVVRVACAMLAAR